VMLGLRLDEPLRLEPVGGVIDGAALVRLEALGLLSRPGGGEKLALTRRGRLLGGGVTADLLA
jgi:hypothetical protein